jgi:hypothetical protein
MVLGLVGPTAILLHANFNSGSRNATVALVSMLLVAGSGIVGRFIYTKIHYESMGRRATIRELREEAEQGRGVLGTVVSEHPELSSLMADLEARLLRPSSGPVWGLWRFAFAGVVVGAAHRRARRLLRARTEGPARSSSRTDVRREYRLAKKAMSPYFDSVKRAARFAGYAYAFSAWHVLHLPLCALLFAAAFFHVVAVHMY